MELENFHFDSDIWNLVFKSGPKRWNTEQLRINGSRGG